LLGNTPADAFDLEVPVFAEVWTGGLVFVATKKGVLGFAEVANWNEGP